MKRRKLVQKLKEMGLTIWEGVPLARYTTIRTGGTAEIMVFPERVEELVKTWHFLRTEGIPYFILSGGSKVLFPDEGFSGVVVNLRRLKGLKELAPGRLEALSGTPTSALIAYGLTKGFSGAEFLAGIPATVGGALYMNAGAFGRCFSELVEELEILTEEGLARLAAGPELWRYRAFQGPRGVFVRAVVRLKPALKEEVRSRVKAALSRRRQTQPFGPPSFGCVFKNPKEAPAGYLIEKAGLKGLARGGAVISEKHANFILNLGKACTNDILYLVEEARERVFRTFGLELQPEVRIVGQA